ncbi:MAG: helix-turn-helix domain-containing protein [Streptosporangiaceae bacterium]
MSSPRARHTSLSATLGRLRRDAGLSQVEAARAAGVTQAKISRLENGRFTPRVEDVRRLARAYSAPTDVRREVERAARDLAEGRVSSRVVLQRGAWRMQQRAGRIEAASARVRAFHPLIVPGLLQTPAYARLVFTARGDMTEEDVERSVAVHMHRQALLDTDRGITLVTTEGALRWQAGGPDVMSAQLERIAEATRHPNVRVGVISWTTPVEVFPQEGFDLYDTRAVIIGTETATATITEPRDVVAYDKLFDDLEAKASFGAEARGILARVAEGYRTLA